MRGYRCLEQKGRGFIASRQGSTRRFKSLEFRNIGQVAAVFCVLSSVAWSGSFVVWMEH